MKHNIRETLISVFAVFTGLLGILTSVPAYSQPQKTDNLCHPESWPVTVLVNQVGYDVNGEKIAVVQLRDSLNKQPGRDFQLIDKSGKTVFSGRLVSRGRVNDGTPCDWGARYWSGDFSRFNISGEYRVRINVENEAYSSFYFKIDRNLIFLETIRPAAHFFWFQRCGCEVPGLHGACHMDDARIPGAQGGGHLNATGGWHDAGDFNKYATISCRTVYALLTVAGDASKQGLDVKSRKEILDEGLWGAEWLYKMWQPGKGIIYQDVWNSYDYWGVPDKETDNVAGTADDRPFRGEGPSAMTAAALAAAARATGRQEYREAAEELWKTATDSLFNDTEEVWTHVYEESFRDYGEDTTGRLVRRATDLLLADLELEALTGKQKYAKGALERVKLLISKQKPDGLWPSDTYSRMVYQGMPAAALALYVKAHHGTETSGEALKSLRLWTDRLSRLTNNTFNLIPWSEGAFFNPDQGKRWYIGQNSQYLSNAWALYLVAPLLGGNQARILADRQMDWVLGLNPLNLCMMEGKGSFNPPFYLHRLAPDEPRGAVPGAIPNGICRANPNQDIPWFDLYRQPRKVAWHTSEPWEPHNAFYILAVSARADIRGNK